MALRSWSSGLCGREQNILENNWVSKTALPVIKDYAERVSNSYPKPLKFSTNGDVGLAMLYGTVFAVSANAIHQAAPRVYASLPSFRRSGDPT